MNTKDLRSFKKNIFDEIPPDTKFPIHILPKVLKNRVVELSEALQVPVEMIVIPTLVMLAGLIGKEIQISPLKNAEWLEHCCLWGIIIAETGNMKTPCLNLATQPIFEIQKKYMEEDLEEKKEWLLQKRKIDQREKAWEKICEKKLSTNPDAELPPRPVECLNFGPEPVARRIVTSDITLEAIKKLMTTSRGLTIIRDELSGWVLNMSRYNKGNDRQYFLECYSGGNDFTDRLSRDTDATFGRYLNIVGGIQTGIVSQIFNLNPAETDGFFERFGLMAFPEKPAEFCIAKKDSATQTKQEIFDLSDKLSAANWKILLQAHREEPAIVRYDTQAQEEFERWLTAHMNYLRSLSSTDFIKGLLNKARGIVARLSLLFHVIEWASNEGYELKYVQKESVIAAITMVDDFLIPTWSKVLAKCGKTKTSDAARLAKKIIESGCTVINRNIILKKGWSGFTSHDVIDKAIADLTEKNWLIQQNTNLNESEKKVGRPPNPNYLINPQFISQEVK